MTDPAKSQSPAEALETIRRSQAAVTEKVAKGSWGYDLIYSALIGGMIAGQAVPPPAGMLVTALCAIGLALLARGWAQRNGFWVSGITPKRARWVAIGLGVVMAFLMFGAYHLSREEGRLWAGMGVGLIAFAAALTGSRLWLSVYRGEARAARDR